MTQRSQVQATFTLEQFVAAAPAKVFHAYSDAETKAQWFGGPPQEGAPTFNSEPPSRKSSDTWAPSWGGPPNHFALVSASE